MMTWWWWWWLDDDLMMMMMTWWWLHGDDDDLMTLKWELICWCFNWNILNFHFCQYFFLNFILHKYNTTMFRKSTHQVWSYGFDFVNCPFLRWYFATCAAQTCWLKYSKVRISFTICLMLSILDALGILHQTNFFCFNLIFWIVPLPNISFMT